MSTVTITVEDSVTTNPVETVIVQVWNDAETTRLKMDVTDVLGQVVFTLPDANYKVYLRKLGHYTFASLPKSLTVFGDMPVTYQGDPFLPSVPPTPQTCVVYGWTYDTGDNPVSVGIKANLVEPDQFTDDGVQVIKGVQATSSSAADGYWELILTRSGEYTAPTVWYSFRINGVFMRAYVIPDQDSVAFAALPENQP